MLSTKEQQNIFNQAKDLKQAFFVDWKSSVEDIVFNVKSILPQLDINSLPEREENGTWIEPVVINSQEHKFETESPSLIPDVIRLVNDSIAKNKKTFIFFNTQDDLRSYILIDIEQTSEYTDKGFELV